MYQSIVKEIGNLALAFEEEKVMILFGPEAPSELREISVIHEITTEPSETPVEVGGKFVVDDQEYTITAVGSAANANLMELGHISIYYTEPFEEVLPGSIFVEPHYFPKVKEASIIKFE